jgi:hypothetical protein
MGSVLWPEGMPDRAIFCATERSLFWQKLLRGFRYGVQGKRMRVAWPVPSKESPILIARKCERRA